MSPESRDDVTLTVTREDGDSEPIPITDVEFDSGSPSLSTGVGADTIEGSLDSSLTRKLIEAREDLEKEMEDEKPTPSRVKDISDVDTDELALLLRNLAHAIEERDLPVTAIDTDAGFSTEEPEFSCSLEIEYMPRNKLLVPAIRLSDSMSMEEADPEEFK